MNLPTCISSNRKIRYTVCFVILITLSVIFFIVSVCAGSVQIPLSDIWRQFRGEQDELYAAILFQIRIPRTFAAILLGGALALSLAMTDPTFADTTGDTPDNTQTEAVWTDKEAADVNTYANIRVDASINSQRVGRLPKGGVAVAVGEKDGWIQVSSGDVEGYIRGDLLVSEEAARDLYVSTYGTEDISVWAEVIEARPQEAEAPQEEPGSQEQESEETAETAVSVSQDDLDLMAAIIECEAGGESYEGKVAVGAVVMNRVNSSKFPNTISEVIYQRGQFSPVASGKLSRVLSRGAREDCYEAARDVLNGANTVGDKLFFSAGSGKGIQIGNQHFY